MYQDPRPLRLHRRHHHLLREEGHQGQSQPGAPGPPSDHARSARSAGAPWGRPGRSIECRSVHASVCNGARAWGRRAAPPPPPPAAAAQPTVPCTLPCLPQGQVVKAVIVETKKEVQRKDGRWVLRRALRVQVGWLVLPAVQGRAAGRPPHAQPYPPCPAASAARSRPRASVPILHIQRARSRSSLHEQLSCAAQPPPPAPPLPPALLSFASLLYSVFKFDCNCSPAPLPASAA